MAYPAFPTSLSTDSSLTSCWHCCGLCLESKLWHQLTLALLQRCSPIIGTINFNHQGAHIHHASRWGRRQMFHARSQLASERSRHPRSDLPLPMNFHGQRGAGRARNNVDYTSAKPLPCRATSTPVTFLDGNPGQFTCYGI